MHIQIVNFKLSNMKPAEYEKLCRDLAPQFAAMPGLISKVWLADAASKCAPGLPAGFCHHHAETGCVAGNGFFCAGWAIDNFHRYVGPFFRQLEIVAISVAVGFVIAIALAVLSHRYRPLAAPLLGFTGVLYTVPSIAFMECSFSAADCAKRSRRR